MLITVLTPTYNRAYIIENLYNSLKRQNYRNFEWIIVDDGSIDNTFEMFELWSKQNNDFVLKYHKVENGGKHRAINKGLDIAQGELFFIVDSDDALTDDALDRIVAWEQTLVNKNLYCGISGLRGKAKSQSIGSTFPGEFCDSYYYERNKNNILGDKSEVFFTKILKNYLFREFENEKFVTEATVWLEMGEKYKIRYFNEVIYICDYLEDGLSKNIDNIIIDNPRGEAFYVQQQIKFLSLNLKDRLASYYYYGKLFKSILTKKQIINYLGISKTTFELSIFIFRNVNNLKSLFK